MRSIVVLATIAALTTTAEAATNRVCWSTEPLSPARCSEPFDQRGAETYLAQVNQEYPNVRHWIITEAPQDNWRRASLLSTGVALAAGLYDIHTTQNVLAAGGVEANPLYGAHPSAGKLYGVTIATVLGQYAFAEWWRHRHPGQARSIDRSTFLVNLGITAVHVSAGVHNSALMDQLNGGNHAPR
jgi:hypothetical protein